MMTTEATTDEAVADEAVAESPQVETVRYSNHVEVAEPLLTIEDLSVEFRTRTGVVKALENIHLNVYPEETVGLVGESGSGKSVLSYTIMNLLESSATITQGQIRYGQENLLSAGKPRDNRPHPAFSMIFQNPRTALNPIRPVGKQLMDVLREQGERHQLKKRAIDLLKQVRLPESRFQAYPFQLSGGMCQRVLIALALARSPRLLVADEPTTGLDVVTQETIMELLQGNTQNRMATILITHDLGLAARYCQRIVVMHAGHVVESAPTETLFRAARHPYTRKLIAATPGIITHLGQLSAIPGQLPDLRRKLPPCRYRHRCENYEAVCDTAPLVQTNLTPQHTLACWNPL